MSRRAVILSPVSVTGTSFAINLVVTVLLLVIALWAGMTKRRGMHIAFAVLTVGSLALAIRQAGIYGEGFVIPRDRLKIHLGFAFIALGLLPLVIGSGVLLAWQERWRGTHRLLAWSFVCMTVIAMSLALWMLSGAPAIEPVT